MGRGSLRRSLAQGGGDGGAGGPEFFRHSSENGSQTRVLLPIRSVGGLEEILDSALDTHSGFPNPWLSPLLYTLIHTFNPRFPFQTACMKLGKS